MSDIRLPKISSQRAREDAGLGGVSPAGFVQVEATPKCWASEGYAGCTAGSILSGRADLRGWLTSFCVVALLAGCGGVASPKQEPAMVDAELAFKQSLRDRVLERMRGLDQTPAWGHSNNWVNGKYQNLVDYLLGDIAPEIYAERAVDGYHFTDVYGLSPLSSQPADYTRSGGSCYFSSSILHMLAGQYYRLRDDRLVRRWFEINRDMAMRQHQQLQELSPNERAHLRDCAAIATGNAQALLNNSAHIMGGLQALALMAKTVDRTANQTASYASFSTEARAAKTAVLSSSQMELFSAAALYDFASGTARNYAPHLLRHYEPNVRMPNQRFLGLSALALLSYFFEGHPDVDELTPSVDRAISAFLEQTINKDGGFLEPSFNYNVGTAKELRMLSRIPDRPWLEALNQALEKWDLLSAGLKSPAHGLPQMGNSVWGRLAVPDLVSFSQESLAFPFSGYYAMRTSWKPDADYLFFYNRRAARGHSMAGGNSLQFGAFGRRLLVAGGIPNYDKADAEYPAADSYRSESSTWKTNTIVVDGRSQLASTDDLNLAASGKPDPNTAPNKPINARWLHSASFDFVEGLHTGGYAGLENQNVTHWRGVVQVREHRLWIIVDVLRSPTQRKYTQIWKFAPPVIDANGAQTEGFNLDQVVTSDTQQMITTQDLTPDAVNVTLRQFGASVNYASYYGSDRGNYGYIGKSFTAGPGFSPDVHATFTGTGDQVLITLLRAHQSSVTDGIEASKDVTTNGIVGADVALADTELSVRVSANLAPLSALGHSVESANLLIVERERGSSQSKALVIGAADAPQASYISNTESRQFIKPAKTFYWTTDSQGRHLAHYE